MQIQNTVIKATVNENNITVRPVTQAITATISSAKGDKGEKGDKGDTGDPGTSYIYEAGEAIGGHRVVIIDNNIAYYADNTNLTHINKPMGISSNAADPGGEVTVVFFGEQEEDFWNWDVDKAIWLSTSGLLTQTPPTVGFSCIIGFPITNKKILVSKQEILILS